MRSIKELTVEVENTCNCKITWELGKTFMALNATTGKVMAEYNPKNGMLQTFK